MVHSASTSKDCQFSAMMFFERCRDPAAKSKQIERCVIATFQMAESMGFKGDFRQWEGLLRIGD